MVKAITLDCLAWDSLQFPCGWEKSNKKCRTNMCYMEPSSALRAKDFRMFISVIWTEIPKQPLVWLLFEEKTVKPNATQHNSSSSGFSIMKNSQVSPHFLRSEFHATSLSRYCVVRQLIDDTQLSKTLEGPKPRAHVTCTSGATGIGPLCPVLMTSGVEINNQSQIKKKRKTNMTKLQIA